MHRLEQIVMLALIWLIVMMTVAFVAIQLCGDGCHGSPCPNVPWSDDCAHPPESYDY